MREYRALIVHIDLRLRLRYCDIFCESNFANYIKIQKQYLLKNHESIYEEEIRERDAAD